MSLGGHLGDWNADTSTPPTCEGCGGRVTSYSSREDLCGACTYLLEVSGVDPRGEPMAEDQRELPV